MFKKKERHLLVRVSVYDFLLYYYSFRVSQLQKRVDRKGRKTQEEEEEEEEEI